MTGASVGRNTAWMTLGQIARTAVQGVYFILIARALGANNYGAFVGVVALVAVAAPFATIGAGNLLIKNVALDRSRFARYWGNGLAISVVSSTVLIGVVMVVGRLILPASVGFALLLLVALGDLLFARLIDLAGQAYWSVDRLSRTAQLLVLSSVTRLVGAAVLQVWASHPSAKDWAVLYMLSSLAAAAISLAMVHREFEAPTFDFAHLRAELREGAYFATGLSAQTIYNDIDKTMLSSMSTDVATGIYGAAYRLVDMAFTPVRSLLFSTYTKFFQHGADGIRGSVKFARRLLPVTLGYGVLMSLGLFLCAPLIPHLLGSGFAESVAATRWLALLPLLKSVHYMAADALTGAGHQGTRTVVQVGVAIFNVLINLWLIPAYGWRGAAWSSLASDAVLAIALWTVLRTLLVRARTDAALEVAPA
jgi:O-antigen/teichoic acid export membrane protein